MDTLTRITGTPYTGDVAVTATIDKSAGVIRVSTRLEPLPRANSWAEPAAEMRRRLVDDLAAQHGVRRAGRVQHAGGWRYVYPIAAV